MTRRGTNSVKNKKFWLILVIILSVLILLLNTAGWLAISGLIGAFAYNRWLAPELNAELDRDIVNYTQYREGREIFPAALGADMTVNDYYYMDASGKSFEYDTYNLYLDVTYAEDAYAAELARLEGYSETHEITYYTEDDKAAYSENITGYFLYDANGEYFNFLAYIAEYDHEGSYEYALLTGNNRIVYVYVYQVGDDDLRMSKYYLPKNYEPFINPAKVEYCIHDKLEVRKYLNPEESDGVKWKIENFGRETLE